MKKNLTELVFILDKSGSMCGLEKDTIGGFNSLIKKQKKEKGEALVTTVLFSDTITTIHDRVDIKGVPTLTENEYFTEGCTALLDAIGTTIKHIKSIQKDLKEEDKPSKTMFVITTDGFENSSKEYTYLSIKKLINKVKKEDKYEFIFLGANIDSELEAVKLGIGKDRAVTYLNDTVGLNVTYGAIENAIADVRGGKDLTVKWKNSIQQDYKNRVKSK